MALRIPPLYPNRPDLFGGKPKLEVLTYSLSCSAHTYEGRDIEGVCIKFVDKLSNIETAHTWTDANGRFSGTVQVNANGYRVSAHRVDWGFSPAFFDAFDQTEAIWFRGKYYGKGDSKESDPK
ncbi:MAG: hypothetical protein NTW28_12030 [Candidatus Solibacter sp.]|nr:hypothetical protein [Candidatus Solibacter sp.]